MHASGASIRPFLAAAVVFAAAAALVTGPRAGLQSDGSYLIPTGQTLTPAGQHIDVNDRPLGMVLSADGSRLAVVTGSNFAPRALHLLDARQARLLDTVPIGNSFVGVVFSPDGRTLYVGGGASDEVKVLGERGGGKFEQQDRFPIPGGAPSGLSLSPDGSTLFVALNLKHSVAIINLPTRQIAEVAVGLHPYTTVAAPSGKKVYVSNWAGRRARPGDVTDELYRIVVDPRTGIPSTGTVSVIDTEKKSVIREIDVGLHRSPRCASAHWQRAECACREPRRKDTLCGQRRKQRRRCR
jgi:DNA-binding beta-propeller fold protein YncE